MVCVMGLIVGFFRRFHSVMFGEKCGHSMAEIVPFIQRNNKRIDVVKSLSLQDPIGSLQGRAFITAGRGSRFIFRF